MFYKCGLLYLHIVTQNCESKIQLDSLPTALFLDRAENVIFR